MSDEEHVGESSAKSRTGNLAGQLLDSPSTLQALGRELAPIIASALKPAGSTSESSQSSAATPTTMTSFNTPLAAPGTFPPPSYPPYPYSHGVINQPAYNPSGWSTYEHSQYGPHDRFQYGPHDRFQYGPQDRFQYGPRDRFQYGPHDRFQYGPHDRFQYSPQDYSPRDRSQYGPRQRGQRDRPDTGDAGASVSGLLASGQASETTPSEGDDDWISLVTPHLTQEERDELSSAESDSEAEEPSSEVVSEETKSFLELAFRKTASLQQRKKWLEKFPRPTNSCANPPTINKPIYSLIQSSQIQTKKKILSHDRFLVKLQRYASDAAGPLTFLLSELQAGRAVPAEQSIQAIQTALCCVGNAYADLSVERRKWILQHLNKQLVPMAEDDLANDGTLFGPDFGKKAKERVDALKSLTSSSSVFFRLSDPPGKRSTKGQEGRGRGPGKYHPYHKKGGSNLKWSRTGQQTRPAPKK